MSIDDRILSALATADAVWTGADDGGGMTTSEIASFLGVKPRSRERDRLNETLTELRKSGRVHYEFDRNDGRPMRWWRS